MGILDELWARGTAGVAEAARHKYGYKVLNGLLELLVEAQLLHLVHYILADVAALSAHPFGTRLVQHLILNSTESQQLVAAAQLAAIVPQLTLNRYSCAALDCAFLSFPPAGQAALAQALLVTQDALGSIAHTYHGRKVVIHV